ncbi:MAG: two-component system response regulator [Halobacteriovorax sp.]|nr:two-component system response regulator [Halobacteriovorax sp.]|tara:strand:- start:3067 stop:3444 length:378 start_codon:yes stop_codon:yes gene_type:complete
MKNILWVDDDLMIEKMVLMYKKKFNVSDVNLIFVHDGNQALDIMKEQSFDIVLLDLNMPVCSGYEFLKRLDHSQLPKSTEIIICSSSSANEDISATKKYGVNEYITKPFDISKLFERISVNKDFS